MENKILVDNVLLDNEICKTLPSVSKVTVKGKSQINLFNINIIDLDINVLDESILTINIFNSIDVDKTLINLKTGLKSQIILNYSFINKNDYELNIITDYLLDNSNIILNINGVNDSGNCKINVDGFVKNNKNNNVLDENVRIININDGSCISNPNMFIATSNVIANHNTVIGGIRDDELFYLMSKGIDESESKNIIIKGFLVKNIQDNDLIIRIKEIL